jgi:hypothetical protein
MAKRSRKVAPVVTTIGDPIMRDLKDHDTKMHHDRRIKAPCPEDKGGCGATIGQRCWNLALLPTRAYLVGFHRARKAPKS